MLAKIKAAWAKATRNPTVRESAHVAALGFVGSLGTFVAGSGIGVHDLVSWSVLTKIATGAVVAGAIGAVKAVWNRLTNH